MRLAPRNHADGGFSLVETLVAITVLAMVAALAFGSLRFGARVWEREAGADPAVRLHLAAHRISELVSGATPEKVRGPNFSVLAPFRGDASELVFVIVETGSEGGLYAVRLVTDPKIGRLTGYRIPIGNPVEMLLNNDWGAPWFTVDTKGPVSFAYRDGEEWRSDWPIGPANPSLFRLRASQPTGSVDHVAAIRAGG